MKQFKGGKFDVIRRYEGNPILTPEDMPAPCCAVYNSGVVKTPDGEYIMASRFEEPNKTQKVWVSRSKDGINFVPDSEPIKFVYSEEDKDEYEEVVDKPELPDNWIETSASCLFIYAYAKAIRKGIIERKNYFDLLMKAYAGMIDALHFDSDGYIMIENVCIGTDIETGTYEHYINREKQSNDLHGTGAFVLMCVEMERMLNHCES